MGTSSFSPRIGIYGSDETVSAPSRGCYLWPLGYGAAVSEAGGTPVSLALSRPRSVCEKLLEDLDRFARSLRRRRFTFGHSHGVAF